ncbi:hypothetical protein K438DRAFT_1966061 [Mycena galopus ATCC 62051]|nr:hypothetical protein K438DRAFT_1966061 [Mycena galopus ATCC 62051]
MIHHKLFLLGLRTLENLSRRPAGLIWTVQRRTHSSSQNCGLLSALDQAPITILELRGLWLFRRTSTLSQTTTVMTSETTGQRAEDSPPYRKVTDSVDRTMAESGTELVVIDADELGVWGGGEHVPVAEFEFRPARLRGSLWTRQRHGMRVTRERREGAA